MAFGVVAANMVNFKFSHAANEERRRRVLMVGSFVESFEWGIPKNYLS